MQENTLVLKLFDPGMTIFHRVGLAGLAMTLQNLDPQEFAAKGSWQLGPNRVTLSWNRNPKELLEPIIKKAFQITPEGAIHYLAHSQHPMGELERVNLHQAVLLSYLQHGGTRKLAGQEKSLSFDLDGKMVITTIKPLQSYKHQSISKELFDARGNFKREIKLDSAFLPGGGTRHVLHGDATALKNPAALFLLLLFAPVASLYFLISHRNRDGKFDKRRLVALVLPHITDLTTFQRNFHRYLQAPVERLYVQGLGDAGLTALTMLNVLSYDGFLQNLEIDSCTVISMGTVSWSTQQKTRTGILVIRNLDAARLNFYALALSILPTGISIKEDGRWSCRPSLARGLLAENIATGKRWYASFASLMQSKYLAYLLSRERKELNDMVQQAQWPEEADRLLVEAVHLALRSRYGAIAQRARERGEVAQFAREFERLRTSLMRTKNATTVRAELADLFARGGPNPVLQEHWQTLLPLFTGSDWQRARDLALLALASYVGKGSEELEATETFANEEE